ncbi:R-linalool synthase QH1, chloroplastic-like protein [Tanacetum coccineum]
MASISISSPSHGFARHYNGRKRTNIGRFPKQLYFTVKAATTNAHIVRRSANYPPSVWSHDYLESLTNKYVGVKHETTLHGLKETVRRMISEDTVVENPLATLELIDDLQRLGLSYHFKDEITTVLKMIYICYYEAHEKWNRLDLNLKAVGFRLLRQYSYHIPQEIFDDIKDETGNFKACVHEDVVGMLNLYEASFLGVEDEKLLDDVREFTTKCLREKLEKNDTVNQSMSMLISHALELPLLWRVQRFEAMWFIEAYKRRTDMKPYLLELAELDFNIVQGTHQEDLKHSSRHVLVWWDGLCWNRKLSFARDRLVESFMWAAGANFEPQHGVPRIHVTKLISLVNVIDDVYDVYGTLDELEQFTEVVRRWDVNAVEGLPDYMKMCFLGFHNTINEMAYNTLINQKSLVIPYVKKVWTDYCEANLLEAQWFNSGYTPTLEEFLSNSCTTVGLPVVVSSAYFLDSNDTIGEALQNVIHWSAMILRLADDLGTSSAELERGDIPKSIQCYMHETGATEEKAKAYIKSLIIEAWKKINKERMFVKSPSLQIFLECASNIGRMGQFTYERGDIFGAPDDLYKSHATSLLFDPKS